jgi:hypothetical protein
VNKTGTKTEKSQIQGEKQRLRSKMSKHSGLLPSMCHEKGAFVLHTKNVRFPAVPLSHVSAWATCSIKLVFEADPFR